MLSNTNNYAWKQLVFMQDGCWGLGQKVAKNIKINISACLKLKNLAQTPMLCQTMFTALLLKCKKRLK